jgi:hypothetical protein
MHLQQTKRASRATGGPQYYFHDLTEPVKLYLREKGVVQVALLTPYGATKSHFFAVSRDRKLGKGHKPILGKVGHDRIQQGQAGESIGEAIRRWYNLPKGDFERVDVDIEIFENVFYITPLYYKLSQSRKQIPIRRIPNPLTFTRHYVSPLWTEQLAHIEQHHEGIVRWALEEICRVVADHRPESKIPHIQEPDLLRASGSLAHFGMKVGAYVGKGYDCVETQIQFLRYPPYTVPVELKRRSRNFQYQEKKYGKEELSRAVVLCAFHDHEVMPKHIDVIELEALCEHARHFSS